MIVKDMNLEGFHYYENCIGEDGTFTYVKDDNEDDFIDININPLTTMCVIEPHIGCSRVYIDVMPFTGKLNLENRIKTIIENYM